MPNRRAKWLIVGLGLVVGIAFLLPFVEFSGGVHLNFYSVSEERRLGDAEARRLESRFRRIAEPRIQAYLDQLGKRVASAAGNVFFKPEFRLLDSPLLNAVALPGGFIYVTRGLVLEVRSEGELAGVLAHEIAHVVSRHGTRQLSRNQLIGFITALGGLASPLPDIVTGLERLSYSRGDELRSDELAVGYLYRAGYHPDVMASFLDLLLRTQKEANVPALLLTHPLSADRVARVRELFSTWPLDERLNRNSDAFREIQALLRARTADTREK